MNRPSVRVVEVVLRDGLQAEAPVDTGLKLEILRRLVDAGHRNLEVTSFVNPAVVPQFHDAEAFLAEATAFPGARLSAFVANQRGLERAVAAGIPEVAVSGDPDVVPAAVAAGLSVRAYLSTLADAFWSGDRGRGVAAALTLLDMGADEVIVADARDEADEASFAGFLEELRSAGIPGERLAVHLHDDHGRALAKAMAAVATGVETVDTALGGLGGHPSGGTAASVPAHAWGGNLSTETFVTACERAGRSTGLTAAAVEDARRDVWAALFASAVSGERS